ncbi:unnamed protein product [Enterobius vermicularis]|uniref:Zinc transporter ZIP8 n=1 Tax=Enterobius vermicularis TaxID=51028 RepID=A0A0N4VIP6_ENTVE|nr:unnamed protein product [Enterobius vermicularis]
MIATFLDIVRENQPQNGTEFCIRFLKDAYNTTTTSDVEHIPPPAWQEVLKLVFDNTKFVQLVKFDKEKLVECKLRKDESQLEMWGVGFTMVVIISLSSALGILLLPFLSPSFYDKTLTFFVALGVGTLSSSAVFHLIPEAFELINLMPNYLPKAATIIAGVYLFFVVDKLLTIICDLREGSTIKPDTQLTTKPNESAFSDPSLSVPPQRERKSSTTSRRSHIASVAWLVVFGDGLHNFIDGLSIGAAFSESLLDGISISIAVLCEEVPHELGDCAILINSGMSRKKALIYNLLSASTCCVGFVIGVLAGEMDRNFGQFIFALAGGMFLYISLAGMLSEINEKAEAKLKESVRSGISTLLLQTSGLATGVIIIKDQNNDDDDDDDSDDYGGDDDGDVDSDSNDGNDADDTAKLKCNWKILKGSIFG